MSDYPLSAQEIQEIEEKLPPQFAALRDRYPITIAAIARDWDLPPYPEGYVPQFIEIYYSEANAAYCPAICVDSGELRYLKLEDPVVDPSLVILDIDDETAYVQVEGRIIFNRLGGAILPDLALSPEKLLQSIIASIPRQ